MNKNNNGNFILPIKKALLAVAVVAISTSVFAQNNDPNNKRQDIKNKSTLDKNYNQNPDIYDRSDGYIMKNGKIMMIKNGQLTQLDKDVTLSNGTFIGKDGTYLIKGGTKTTFREGEHMDLMGKINQMDKTKNHNKSEMDKSSGNDTMSWKNDTIKNRPAEKLNPPKRN